jgi:dCMP deaminase
MPPWPPMASDPINQPEATPSSPPQGFAGLMRMPWDVYFLAICDAVKLRSIDKETQNGSVIVNEHRRIVSTGYNAFPAGVDDSFWPKDRVTTVAVPKVGFEGHKGRSAASVADPNKKYAVEDCYSVDKYAAMCHAEMNAVVAAGQDLHGCCIYTLLFPCHECAKAIITSGIKRVVFTVTREDPSWAVAKELFLQSGVEMVGPEKP